MALYSLLTDDRGALEQRDINAANRSIADLVEKRQQ